MAVNIVHLEKFAIEMALNLEMLKKEVKNNGI
jgi:hypothetical protein